MDPISTERRQCLTVHKIFFDFTRQADKADKDLRLLP